MISTCEPDSYTTLDNETPAQFHQVLKRKIYYDTTIYSEEDSARRIEEVTELRKKNKETRIFKYIREGMRTDEQDVEQIYDEADHCWRHK